MLQSKTQSIKLTKESCIKLNTRELNRVLKYNILHNCVTVIYVT